LGLKGFVVIVVQGMPLSYTKQLNNSMSLHRSFQLYNLTI
jgi:hypothetical protein